MNDIADLSSAFDRAPVPTDGADAPSTWVIVTQVKSNRVVYFTDDPAYQPPMDGDWYYCSTWQGALPDGMTLRNCWGWRFNGGVFSDAREAPKRPEKELLIENNRKALLRILREKIDAVRAPFLPACAHGEALRLAKRQEAQAFLANPDSEREYPLLQAVAVARNISLLEAARLVEAKAGETERVLHETERFREQLTQAILAADGEPQLLELREWLLDRVYPELSRQFAFRVEHTEPPDLDAPIKDAHRLHEITRLKTQLREAINRQRAPLHSDYIGNDEMRRHKARLAQQLLLAGGTRNPAVDYSPLEAYAEGRNLPLHEAAQLVVDSLAFAAELLARTEAAKDRMLGRIDGIRTLRDIENVALELEAL